MALLWALAQKLARGDVVVIDRWQANQGTSRDNAFPNSNGVMPLRC